MIGNKPLLTKRELAELMSVSLRTVTNYMYRKHDPLPFTKVAGKRLVRFNKKQVNLWLERNSFFCSL